MRQCLIETQLIRFTRKCLTKGYILDAFHNLQSIGLIDFKKDGLLIKCFKLSAFVFPDKSTKDSMNFFYFIKPSVEAPHEVIKSVHPGHLLISVSQSVSQFDQPEC